MPGDVEDEAASAAAVKVVLDVLSGYHLDGDAAIDATRTLRSALHGFVSLETSGGFGLPVNIDHSFKRLVDALITVFEIEATRTTYGGDGHDHHDHP
jgi:hypothetical protein